MSRAELVDAMGAKGGVAMSNDEMFRPGEWMNLQVMQFIQRMAERHGADPRKVLEGYLSGGPTLSHRETAEQLAAERGGSVDEWERFLAGLTAEFRAQGEAERFK